MHFTRYLIFSALSFAISGLAAGNIDWQSRSIYQVLTDRFGRPDGSTTTPCDLSKGRYCGGSWSGIVHQLDYIQSMGFDAIWISPITSQVDGTKYGDGYHGYWQKDIFSLNEHFGSPDDLKNLADALHARGMYLMVDVVVNHFGWNGDPSSVNYTSLVPFTSQDYFHPYCKIDYNDIQDMNQIETCWMGDTTVSLPDLRTENSDVVKIWSFWIAELVSKYGIDGLRLDSAMEVDPAFWSEFLGTAGSIFAIGEVFNGDSSFTCGYQNQLPSVMNYPIYFPLINAFKSSSGSISSFTNAINNVKKDCPHMSLLGSFSENHDNPRFASMTDDMALAQNVLTYTMLTDGIPIVYQGQEQHFSSTDNGGNDPYNREALWLSGYNKQAPLYQLAAKLNKARKQAISTDQSFLGYNQWPIASDQHTAALRKGEMMIVLSNAGASSSPYSFQFSYSGLNAGANVTELLTCTHQIVDSEGKLTVSVTGGLPKVYLPAGKIGNYCS